MVGPLVFRQDGMLFDHKERGIVVLSFARKWVQMENILLNKLSQPQKDICSLICGS